MPVDPQALTEALAHIDIPRATDLVVGALEAGHDGDEEELVETISDLVDLLTPFELAPAPAGPIVETVLDLAVPFIVASLVRQYRDPAARQRWIAHRAKVAARRQARKARRLRRQGARVVTG